jgi:Flp pilus assembly protein TadG
MVALMRFIRRFLRAESGAEMIEFGLTLPLLLLLVSGMVEFGFVLQQYEVVTNAAREGARLAALPTYGGTQTARVNNATARVNQYLTNAGLNQSLAGVTVGVGGTGAAVPNVLAAPATGCVWTVPVTVTYPHPLPFLRGIMSYFGVTIGTITVRSTAQMRTEAQASTCP